MNENDIEIVPCRRCGKQPTWEYGYSSKGLFCAHCLEKYRKELCVPLKPTAEEAAEAWNAMQQRNENSDYLCSDNDFRRWTMKDDIDAILDKLRAIMEVCKSSQQRTGSSYITAVLNYLESETATIRNRLHEVRGKVKLE